MSAIVGQVFHFEFSHARIKIAIHVGSVGVMISKFVIDQVCPTISDWSEGWEQVSKAIGHCGMYQEKAAMESFDEITREVVKRLGFQNICLSENIVADRARFAEIYQAIKKRKRTEVNVESALPNLWEMVQNRLAELAQKGQKVIEQEKDKN